MLGTENIFDIDVDAINLHLSEMCVISAVIFINNCSPSKHPGNQAQRDLDPTTMVNLLQRLQNLSVMR